MLTTSTLILILGAGDKMRSSTWPCPGQSPAGGVLVLRGDCKIIAGERRIPR